MECPTNQHKYVPLLHLATAYCEGISSPISDLSISVGQSVGQATDLSTSRLQNKDMIGPDGGHLD